MVVPRYLSKKELLDLLQKAEYLGYPLDKGSYLEQMTIQQLEDLVKNGRHDA
jgi:hypothetical protein